MLLLFRRMNEGDRRASENAPIANALAIRDAVLEALNRQRIIARGGVVCQNGKWDLRRRRLGPTNEYLRSERREGSFTSRGHNI